MSGSAEDELRWFLQCWQTELPSTDEIAARFRSVFEPASMLGFLRQLQEHAPNPELSALDAGHREALALLDVDGSAAELWVAITSEGISGLFVRPHDSAADAVALAELQSEPAVAVDGDVPPMLVETVTSAVTTARAAGMVGVAAHLRLPGDRGSISVDDGHADAFAGTPVSSTTSFGLASVTKVLTAMAVLERFDPDEPVRGHSHSVDVLSDAVTFRHLITHTAGVPRLEGATVRFEHDPGGEPEYSNDGYDLLGSVLADAPGAGSAVEVIEAVLGVRTDQQAVGHRVAFGQVTRAADRDAPGGAGGAVATAAQMGRFAEAVRGPAGEAVRSVLGGGRRLLAHDGATSGFRSTWWVDLERGASCTVLTNAEGPVVPSPWDVRDQLLEAVQAHVD